MLEFTDHGALESITSAPRDTHLLQDKSCQVCSSSSPPFFFLSGQELRGQKTARELAHMGNGPTNQDEIKIKRGAVDRERQLALMNNICPRHSLNQIILPLPGLYLRAYLSLPVTVPVISPSLPLVFFFFFSLSFLRSPLRCCAIVDLPRGTVGCCRSTRVTGVSLLC